MLIKNKIVIMTLNLQIDTKSKIQYKITNF